MNEPDRAVSRVAAAIGEPARARILYRLMDGHARTSTELAVVAGVSASTASVHLHQLMFAQLINVLPSGRYRYYSLDRPEVAQALESLAVLVGGRWEVSSRARQVTYATPEPVTTTWQVSLECSFTSVSKGSDGY